MRTNSVVSSGLVAVALAACVSSPVDEEELTQAGTGTGQTAHWRIERARRQAELDQYNADHAAEYASFKNAALGTSGIPMIMLRLFPEMFPHIWGPPSLHFAPVGLGEDTLEPGRVLPLGLGYASTPISATASINVVQLTCAGCHTGRVKDADGAIQHMIGAPSTQFTRFRGSVFATVNDPGYTAAAFTAALNAKPAGWVYGLTDAASLQKEMTERAVFNAVAPTLVAALKTSSIAGAQRFAQTLGAYTYGMTPNAPNPSGSTPGYLDAIGAGITIVVDPAVLTPAQVQAAVPPKPAMIDIMSVWNQKDRPSAQWDGSITSKLHRNLAAELGVVGRPDKLNMDNVNKTTAYTEHLPSNPYPFDVDTSSAARGRRLFDAELRVVSHRRQHGDLLSRRRGHRCEPRDHLDPVLDGWPHGRVARRLHRRSHLQQPRWHAGAGRRDHHEHGWLHGAAARWHLGARAVPAQRLGAVDVRAAHGRRPVTFQRGNIAYDQVKMGFVETAGPFTAEFDTTRSGNSNTGHNTPEFNGYVDWKNEPKKLEDLLSYLKTL